jgi:23S rRNA pseudouridine2605 synthase
MDAPARLKNGSDGYRMRGRNARWHPSRELRSSESVYRHSSLKPTHNLRRTGLARGLSKLGYCSRAQARKLIREGSVQLNGAVRRDPETPVDIDRDRIAIGGRRIDRAEKIYLLLNKPRGVVTTTSDEQGRQTVYSYLRKGTPWVAPVGRLDKASEGLLLLTNDSGWGAQITAPETHLEKAYHVHIDAVADEELTAALRTGVRLQDDEVLRATRAEVIRKGTRNSWIEVTLDEGKNRQIRRMLEHLGIGVLRIIRVAIGPLDLGNLAKGECRPLTINEKQALDQAMVRAGRLPRLAPPTQRVESKTGRSASALTNDFPWSK